MRILFDEDDYTTEELKLLLKIIDEEIFRRELSNNDI